VNQPDRDDSVHEFARHLVHGRRPVCGHARVRATGGVELHEHDGQTELFDTSTGAGHRVSRAAAALWAELDGRALREIRPAGEPDTTGGCGVAIDVIELVRRFKALGLVEDLP